jgi:predicted phage terminase large subunit-like protein
MTIQESTRATATRRTVDDKPLDPEGAKLWENSWYALARKDFWTYRCMVRPNLIEGWWQQEVADNLTTFWYDLKAGKRPKLVLGAPPQHGKSDTMKDFCCWVAGKDPDSKTLFASYADELGMSCNLHMQRMMATPAYRAIFPKTRLYGGEGGEGSGHRRRTTTFLEFVGRNGSFRNTTINGKINGFGLDLGVIDDPIKGRAEAQSTVIRDKTWNWLSDDFFNRFSDRAGMVMIQTRWHVDDPTGRWLDRFPNTRVLNFKAIADRNELYRDKGEALFPEHKSLEFLLERKKLLSEASWEALFQQSPYVVGGGMFPIERLHAVPMLDRSNVRRSVRYWDKAGTEDEGAHTAGVLMHLLMDGRYIIEHVVRGQWNALDREQRIKFWAEHDRANLAAGTYEVGVEQEPGSGGKESAEASIRMLAGFRAFADKVTGDKVIRAEPFSAQVQNGNVWLVAGGWHHDFLEEMESFPFGKAKDQIDAAAGAFNRITAGAGYNLFAEGLDD